MTTESKNPVVHAATARVNRTIAVRAAYDRIRRPAAKPSTWKVGTRVHADHPAVGSYERVGKDTLRVHAPFGHIDVKKKMSHDDWIAHAATHGPDVLHHAMTHYHKTGNIDAETIGQAKKKATPKKSKQTQSEEREMSSEYKKLRDIVEAEKKLHPMALHVKPVKVDGQTKYQVHAVGSGLSDGIKHGEHLSDSELDDAHEMGAKIRHIKEETIVEGEIAHNQYLKYHGEAKKLLDGISKGLDMHHKNISSKQGYSSGQVHWGHVGDMKSFHRDIQDLHDRVLQQGEYSAPVQAKSIKEAAAPENDDGPEPDKNITVQLKKAADMMKHGEKGGADISFADGKTHHVAGHVAHKVLSAMEKMKPAQRADAQKAVHTSHAHLMAAHKMLSK